MPFDKTLLADAPSAVGEVTFKIAATSDVHGNFFPYDFIGLSQGKGSLSRVATRVKQLRESIGDESVILLDNGDILQGQPTAYYYNFIDMASTHLAARMLDYIGYDAETIGNHDIETGHAVYDRYRADLGKIPLLGANVIDLVTGKPYFQPYTIIERHGVKFAVLGLITPAIPAWLPENLWKGLFFDDMLSSAKKWVSRILEIEKPDVMIGLFHSGKDSSKKTGEWIENASKLVAEEIPDFDVIFMGHDHKVYNSENEVHSSSDVLILNPANNAENIAEAEIKIIKRNGVVIKKNISGEIVPIGDLTPDPDFMEYFEPERRVTENFVMRRIGYAEGDFSVRQAYFGPSAFMQLLHELQLEISGADISLAAPLAFDALIKKGDLHISDMFTLYKYENVLYTVALSGLEIKNYLEMSYSLWTDVMKTQKSHLLLFSGNDKLKAKDGYAKLKHPSYNFDSAEGIIYTVDVTKQRGEKINIISMADGSAFDYTKRYKVALNSYRGNGGGDLLTDGAGIPYSLLKSRILSATDKDLRYYIIKKIENRATITPYINYNWKFTPDDLVASAIDRDFKILFE